MADLRQKGWDSAAQDSSQGIIDIINNAAKAKQSQIDLQKSLMLDQITRERNRQDKQNEMADQQSNWMDAMNQGQGQGNPTTNTSGMANSATPNVVGDNPNAPTPTMDAMQPIGGAIPQGGYTPQQPPPMTMADPSQQAARDAASAPPVVSSPIINPSQQETPASQIKDLGFNPVGVGQLGLIRKGNPQSKDFAYIGALNKAKQGIASPGEIQLIKDFNGYKSKDENVFNGIDTVNSSPDEIGQQLKAKNPGEYSYLEGLKDGKVNIAGRTSKDLRSDMRKVDTIWPGTDFTTVQTRIKMRNDYTSGPTARNLDALNTAIHHADTAYEQINKLNNGDFKSANGFGNWIKRNVGDPRVDVLNSTLGVLNREVNKAIAAGVVTNEDKQNFENSLSSAQSSKVAKSVIDNYINLIAGRTQPLKERLDSYLPNSGIPVLRKSAQEILQKHGFSYNSDTGDIEQGNVGKSNNDAFIQNAKTHGYTDQQIQEYLAKKGQ